MTTFYTRRGGVGSAKASAGRVGHVYFDARQRTLYCLNDVAQKMLEQGTPFLRDEPGQSSLRTLSGAAVHSSELPLLRACAEQKPQEGIYLFAPGDGPLCQLIWSSAPLHDADGHLIGVTSSLTLLPPEPDWQHLAGLAHDLRTPLQSLRLLSTLLENTPQSPDAIELLQRLRSAAERAVAIGLDLLEECRGPVASQRLQCTWFALGAMLETLVGEHRPDAQRKGITLETALAEAQDQEMLGDAVRLGRLVSNLLTNAIRYTSEGEVRVQTGWRSDPSGKRQSLVLSVIDTGTGIAEEDQDSIFEPYERGKAGKEGDSSGSGLGLSVVDRLVQEMGLTLELYSQYGQGSTFALHLPVSILRVRLSSPDPTPAPSGRPTLRPGQ